MVDEAFEGGIIEFVIKAAKAGVQESFSGIRKHEGLKGMIKNAFINLAKQMKQSQLEQSEKQLQLPTQTDKYE